jgi:hypothetical protein
MSVYFHPNFIDGVDSWESLPDTNVANTNARLVLESLGLANADSDFNDICYGSCPTNDFMGRVLMALAVAPTDNGTITVSYREGTAELLGATVYEMGRSVGYLQDKLARLLVITQWAVDNNHDRIVWG